MASVFKRKRDRLRKNSSWFIAYYRRDDGVERSAAHYCVRPYKIRLWTQSDAV